MIISDKHQLAFIHIPKCGGTSVKKALEAFDDRNGLYKGVKQISSGDYLDFTHLTMRNMREMFNEEYELLKRYNTFAICRNPADRFLSAIMQHIKAYDEAPYETITKEELGKKIDEIILNVEEKLQRNDYKYIYFRRQSDFIFDRDTKIIKNIYRLEDVEAMWRDISKILGLELGSIGHENMSLQTKNEIIGTLVKNMSPRLKRSLTLNSAFVKGVLKKLLYVPADQKRRYVLESENIKTFIQKYYARDFEIYENTMV